MIVRNQLIANLLSIIVSFTCFDLFALPSSVKTSPEQLNRLWQSFSNEKSREVKTYYPHHQCFITAAEKYELSEALLLALARGESNFERNAKSKANAIGIMQIQWPGTAKHLGINKKSELYEPCKNIDAGSRYLKELIKRYKGNLFMALAAYNYGPGRIKINSTASEVPPGAHWYSEYIYDHLQYIVSTQTADYTSSAQQLLITFNRPYRAKNFVKYLEKKVPRVRFDWFKKPFDRFEVVFFYENSKQKQIGSSYLEPLGFTID